MERLTRIREVYFGEPGRTLGGRVEQVTAQDGYPENQLWMQSRVVFAAIHVVGSNTNLEPGTCYEPFDTAFADGNAPETPAMAAP